MGGVLIISKDVFINLLSVYREQQLLYLVRLLTWIQIAALVRV